MPSRSAQGFVVDGFPRTAAQAVMLEQALTGLNLAAEQAVVDSASRVAPPPPQARPGLTCLLGYLLGLLGLLGYLLGLLGLLAPGLPACLARGGKSTAFCLCNDLASATCCVLSGSAGIAPVLSGSAGIAPGLSGSAGIAPGLPVAPILHHPPSPGVTVPMVIS
jgi:hypothetical protein